MARLEPMPSGRQLCHLTCASSATSPAPDTKIVADDERILCAYEAARRREGGGLVFLDVDFDSYSRERILGKVRAFRAAERTRSILIVTPTAERIRLVAAWVRDACGQAALDEIQAPSFDEVRAGMPDPGTEPLEGAGAPEALAA